jgi:hypothetical protein
MKLSLLGRTCNGVHFTPSSHRQFGQIRSLSFLINLIQYNDDVYNMEHIQSNAGAIGVRKVPQPLDTSTLGYHRLLRRHQCEATDFNSRH